jgi:hypothetical protein
MWWPRESAGPPHSGKVKLDRTASCRREPLQPNGRLIVGQPGVRAGGRVCWVFNYHNVALTEKTERSRSAASISVWHDAIAVDRRPATTIEPSAGEVRCIQANQTRATCLSHRPTGTLGALWPSDRPVLQTWPE